jgi:hypothetical protein
MNNDISFYAMEKEFSNTLENLVSSSDVITDVINFYTEFKYESKETFSKIDFIEPNVLPSSKFEILMLLKFIMENPQGNNSLCFQ